MNDLPLALLLSTALAALAVWRRALTLSATVLAWAFSVCITYIGGVPAFLALASTFSFTMLAGKLFPNARKRAEEINHKSGRRDAVQIICNVFIGTVCLLIYALTENEAFFIAYGAALAASLADSMASEIGVLSKKKPVDICTLAHVPAGLSGGVTALGLFSSLLGAAIVSAVFTLTAGAGAPAFAVITAAGFLAALFDSVLGSLFQVKYRCAVCGKVTEKPLHCGQKSEITGGVRWFSNDLVNFCNNVFSAVLACLIWHLIK